MITDIRLQCPTCKRNLTAAAVADSETAVVKRTCQGCHTKWQIVARLLKRTADKAIHKLEWVKL